MAKENDKVMIGMYEYVVVRVGRKYVTLKGWNDNVVKLPFHVYYSMQVA